jgi:hypothetical protein
LILKAKGDILLGMLHEEKERDRVICEKYIEYDFMEPRHLEIPNECGNIAVALAELGKINKVFSCRDKLLCISNTIRIVNMIIKNSGRNMHGADDTLPLLIYVMLKARQP